MADSKPPPGDELSDLRRRVDAARGIGVPENEPPESAASLALKFGGEFGAAVVVGAIIGFGIDYWAHTSPLGLIVGMGLGFCAGVMNVMRTAKAYSQRHPVNPNAPSIPDDED
ncbi:MAG TPA: AtpZ/AtpI family protein [Caulobacterales bacterium]|jgi:ATP synthase protein I|nr:AtpZ/AtpI family protein [Caulobacterales bacterium]